MNKPAMAALAVVLVAAALWFLVPWTLVTPVSFETATVTILAASGPVLLSVEVADQPHEWARGLMFRESLEEGSGMLFVFGDERIRSFWMKSTLIPLDILFMDAGLTIIDIVEGAAPCEADPCPLYTSRAPARYALEVNAGFVQDHRIRVDDTVVLEG